MIRHVVLSFACLASIVVDVGRAFVLAIDRFVAFAIAAVAEKQPREISFAGPALVPSAPGAPLDAALLHGLRHEAHVRRRSADRNI